MNLLDRYIFRSVLSACAGAIGLFTFIVIVPNIARDLLPRVLAGQLPASSIAELVVLLLPHAITYALPMGMLTGVLLTLGRLSADSEITAMRAAGISIPRLALPVFLLAGSAVAVALYFNFESMPRTRVQYYRQLAAAVRANPLSFIVPKTFIREFPGYVIYVNDKQGGVLRDFWLWELDAEKRVLRVVHAMSGRIDYDEAENELILRLSQAKVESRAEKNPEDFSEAQLVGSFEQSDPIRLSLDGFFGRTGTARMKDDWLTLAQLREVRADLAAQPVPADEREADDLRRKRMKIDLIFNDKINISLAVLSLAFIGVPLGITVSRRETSANFAVALGVTLAYYLLTLLVKVLDRQPEFRPDLLLWIPNLILIGVATWLLIRVERR